MGAAQGDSAGREGGDAQQVMHGQTSTREGREPFKDAAMRGWSEGERGGRQQDERGTEDKESQG